MIDHAKFQESFDALTQEQKERFFFGGIQQAEKVISGLLHLLGSGCTYSELFELYMAVAIRIFLFDYENDRIAITVKMRFSLLVPLGQVDGVLAFLRNVFNNYIYLSFSYDKQNAYAEKFDIANKGRFAENRLKSEDAIDCPDFGLSPSNPVYAHSTYGSYEYLNLLYTAEGLPLTWLRRGSISGEATIDLIDLYDLFLPTGELYKSVYINMYADYVSAYLPDGFSGNNLSAIPAKKQSGNSIAAAKTADGEDEFSAFLKKYAKK